MRPVIQELSTLLDRSMIGFDAGSLDSAFDELVSGLQALRTRAGVSAFLEQAVPFCRYHPLYDRLEADPLTRRARRVDGCLRDDAVLSDYVYFGFWDAPSEPVSAKGQALFRCTAVRSARALSIRERRNFLGTQLDMACTRRGSSRILAVGCGHLRETGRSMAIIGESFGELVALDEDRACLEEVEFSASSRRIQTALAARGNLLGVVSSLGTFDFIYVPTHFEHLGPSQAQEATLRLWESLRPGGRLLIANHQGQNATQAYLEVFTAWRSVTRSLADWRTVLAHGLPETNFLGSPANDVIYVWAER